MRIVGDIPHPELKITIFLHDSKYAVKFESGLYELTYKFRSGEDIDSIRAIKEIITDKFISDVIAQLSKMHQQKQAAIKQWIQTNETETFDEII